eukprot:COSAG02_NODE_1504_length_12250_cov_12.501934_5_plen_78_part_00
MPTERVTILRVAAPRRLQRRQTRLIIQRCCAALEDPAPEYIQCTHWCLLWLLNFAAACILHQLLVVLLFFNAMHGRW